MAAPKDSHRGRLKIFLGYAAGVGKTYQMLAEGQAQAKQGVDVVIGYFEPHQRKDTIAKTEGLEMIPRRMIEYRGTQIEEMDTEAILKRKPQLALVDELPHTNAPGSETEKRWEDVLLLLNAGINVYSTMNIQHLESLNDQVFKFTGVRVRETIPDWFVRDAEEVVLVDLTPRALLNRLARGVVYAPDKAQKARDNFFKEPTLVALRELALRQTAQEVDLRTGSGPAPSEGPPEKVLVVVSEDRSTTVAIRRARRVADYLKAECFAVFVCPSADLEALPKPKRETVERHLDFARNLHLETRVLAGDEPAQTIVDFARRNAVTQILIHRPAATRIPMAFAHQDLVFQLLRLAREFQVTVVANRTGSAPLS
jgi:two-component system sensor histidine kinase KdpD